jgi:Peptidase A4 family
VTGWLPALLSSTFGGVPDPECMSPDREHGASSVHSAQFCAGVNTGVSQEHQMITTRRLAAAAATAATALAFTGAAASGAAAGSLPALPSRVAHIGAATVTIRGDWKRASVKLPRTHLPRPEITRQPSAVSHSVSRHSVSRHSVGRAESTNWGGYTDVAKSGVALRYVTATFNAPAVNCANSPRGTSGYAYVSAWTGLDGWGSNTVEQQGFDNYCGPGNDPSGTFAWYEMYPADPVSFTGANPGDALQSSTFYNASTGNYTLAVTDLTQNGAGISVTVPCAGTCKNHSAEVISEDPGGAVPTFNLADFGAQSYTSAAVTSRSGVKGNLASGSLWNGFALTMTDPGGALMTVPGTLQGNTAFLNVWRAAS